MSGPNLFLWVMIEPLSIVFGLVVAVVAYLIAHPRPGTFCGELLIEGWRIYAILAAVPAFVLGAELGLWLVLLDYQAPIAHTRIVFTAGLCLAALAGTPLIIAYCKSRPLLGVPAAIAGAMLVGGLALFAVGISVRESSWSNLAQSAPNDTASLHEMANLKSYRYVSDERAREALEAALPEVQDTLDLVAATRDNHYPALDGLYMKPFLADRLATAIRGSETGDVTELRREAIPAYWWLTRNSKATLLAYAMSVPELRSAALVSTPDNMAAIAYGLTHEDATVVTAILEALYAMRSRDPLDGPAIAAIAAHLDDPEPIGDLALAILLTEASRASLIPILPRFVDDDSPAWDTIQDNCPQRTNGLVALIQSDDETVAQGAAEVLGYVRQYCTNWQLPGG